ncbi:hypothetical protein GCM10029964_094390 [Kibdelosporangium lantanae]
MPRRLRLDAELVRRGLARSREHASQLITDGHVTVRGVVAQKPATAVETDAAVVVREDVDEGWASRGAHKLIGALAAFDVPVKESVAWTRARPPAASRMCCCATEPSRSWPRMWGVGCWCGGCETTRAWSCWTRPTPATSHPS